MRELLKPIFQKLRYWMKGQDVSLFLFHLLSVDSIFVKIPNPRLMTSPCINAVLALLLHN